MGFGPFKKKMRQRNRPGPPRRSSSVYSACLAAICRSAARRVPKGIAAALIALGFVCAIPSAEAQQKKKEAPAAAPLAAAPVADDPECLTISQSSSATYMIENKSCPEASVLASIELADEGTLARCFTKKIRSQISIASQGAVPYINYQCIEGAPGCSIDVLRTMFPECHAG